jgi:hypothetical protein
MFLREWSPDYSNLWLMRVGILTVLFYRSTINLLRNGDTLLSRDCALEFE